MSNMRMILLEATLVAGVLMTGVSVSHIAYAAPLAPATADPQSDVKIDSLIKVERTVQSENGENATELVDPATVKIVPGDKLLFINRYQNSGDQAVTGFVVEVLEDWALVSVDGGKSFGKLAELSVVDGEQASRPAVASDVTHIRWILPKPIAPGASGELRFRGTVK
mgnify:CR=1 FL=1